jgi:arylformamidase
LLRAARSHETDGYEVTEICLGSHSGTHLDAPRHFFPHGRTLDQFPLQRLVGPGVLVDCTEASALIDGPLLAGRLAQHGGVPAGGIVLVRTGGRLFSLEAAELLVDRGAGIVGTDSPSLDAAPYPVHELLLAHDILLLENLHGLDQMEPGPLTCACLPLPLVDGDAAPVRVVAWR